jgi:hypothetical protein
MPTSPWQPAANLALRRRSDEPLPEGREITPPNDPLISATPVELMRSRQMRAAALIAQHSAQQLVSPRHAAQLAALLQYTTLASDQNVFDSSASAPSEVPLGSLVLVLRGEVCLELHQRPSAPRTWSVVGPGQWIGELPDPGEPESTAAMRHLACGHVELGVLRLASLRHLMLQHAGLAASVLAAVNYQLASRLREAYNRGLLQHQWMAAVALPHQATVMEPAVDLELD